MGNIIHNGISIASRLVNPTAETVFSDGVNRIVLGKNGRGAYDGKLIRLYLSVRVTGGTTTNFTLQLRYASSDTLLTTFTNDTVISATVAQAVNTVTRMFVYEVEFVWDSTTARMFGNLVCNRAGTVTTRTAFANVVTTAANESQIGFIATGLFSATNANNVALLTQFELEQP